MDCLLAIDLGTTAFKAAPVDANGLVAPPVVVRYALDYAEGAVTCPPERYYRTALRALRGAARAAKAAGRTIQGIGISSQAQTFLPLNHTGEPLQDAIVWTDDRAAREAVELAELLPDYGALSGFCQPSPLQFLPKVRYLRQNGLSAGAVWKFLLLNEYLIYRLTGEVYGDETNQGMGGFYHIARREWAAAALTAAGITADQLATVAPAAGMRAPLTAQASRALGLEPVPVASCGNDQSCAAAGAGLEVAGDVLCNFGTAMVVYAAKSEWTAPRDGTQIAGIDPLTSRYFLLSLESECGNVVEWLASLLFPRGGVPGMLKAALAPRVLPRPELRLTPIGGGQIAVQALSIGCQRVDIARALLEHYADRFRDLLSSVSGFPAETPRLFASGGLSRSPIWLDFLSRKHGLPFQPTAGEHPGLLGIARIFF